MFWGATAGCWLLVAVSRICAAKVMSRLTLRRCDRGYSTAVGLNPTTNGGKNVLPLTGSKSIDRLTSHNFPRHTLSLARK